MKLLVAVPSNRPWQAHFGISLLRLAVHLNGCSYLEDVDIRPWLGVSLLPVGRQLAVDTAIAEEFTHLLFVDDDMGFDPSVFESLRSHKKDFIAANYMSKGPNGKPVAAGMDGEVLPSKGKTGIEQILQIGLGCALVAVEPLKTIPKPHFEVPYVEDKAAYMGEDAYFCRLLTHFGVEMFVDHDATRKVVHIGDYPYQEDFGDECLQNPKNP